MGAPESNNARVQSATASANAAREVVDAARERARAQTAARQKDRARDAILVEQTRQGDAKAFKRLVELHQGRLFAVAFGMLRDRDDAMDVVQDAFIKAHKKLGEFEGAAAFSTWLYRICVNLCIDKKRSDGRRKKVDMEDAAAVNLSEESLYADVGVGPRLSGSNPLKNASSKELGREIDAALAGLTEDHRSILLLREVEGMSYEEISETLGVPRGTVMSRLFHARKNMQRLLRPFLGLTDDEDLGGKIDPAQDSESVGEHSPAPKRPKA
jgi:RNA polymerase sigma-70 factor (ECF subfamily)